MSGDGGLNVRGGAGGVGANLDDMRHTADIADGIGDRLRDVASEVGRVATDGDLLASAVLGPSSAARVQAQVADAVARVAARSVVVEGYARGLRATASAFEAVDEAGRVIADRAQAALGGATLAVGVPATIGFGLVRYPINLATRVRQGVAVKPSGGDADWIDMLGAAGGDTTGDIAGIWTDLLLDHPVLTDAVIESGGDIALPGPASLSYEDTTSLVLTIGGLFRSFNDDAPIAVTPVGVNERTEPAYKPEEPDNAARRALDELRVPGSFADLMSNQTSMQLVAKPDTDSSRIRVVEVPQQDGSTNWIVHVPGTQEWGLQAGADPSDLTSNLHLQGPEDAAMLDAIDDAMRQAGVQPDDPVLMSGHSQGGIASANFAVQADQRGYNVTNVFTAGSPIAHINIPDHVDVLSIEHTTDPVPRLDGDVNPDRANWTSISRDIGGSDMFEDPIAPHDSVRYTDTAGQIDQLVDNESVDAYLDTATGFFTDGGLVGSDAMASGRIQDFKMTRSQSTSGGGAW